MNAKKKPPIFAVFAGAALLLALITLKGPTPSSLAGYPPSETPEWTPTQPFPTLPPTNTPVPTSTPSAGPTSTPPPSPTGGPTAPPDQTATPSPTPLEVHYNLSFPNPPDPPPPSWVGVIDYLVENVRIGEHWEGYWITYNGDTLWEERHVRFPVDANSAAEGHKCPGGPIGIQRPLCDVFGQQVYVAGTWYHNGLAGVQSEYHSSNEIPDCLPGGITCVLNWYHVFVPEPPEGTRRWNFGADYTCESLGGGGEPSPTPTLPPPPPETPTPTPVPGCPACSVTVYPRGTYESPAIITSSPMEASWTEVEAASFYRWKLKALVGGSWTTVDGGDTAESGVTLELQSELLYRLSVGAHFEEHGECCGSDTYLRLDFEIPPISGTLEARADYWSDLDDGSSPSSPRRTTQDTLPWNWGQFLHIHPSADFEVDDPGPDWLIENQITHWRFCGSMDEPPTPGGCTSWYEDPDPPNPAEYTYIHLLWTRDPPDVTEPDTWVYQAEPQTVQVIYDLIVETTLTYLPTGVVYGPFETTWENMVINVPLIYRYQTVPQ